MADRIRFYLDEHITKAIADGLHRHGIDVMRAQEVGLRQAGDLEHIVFARQDERVVVTHDADFLRAHYAGISHTGIAYCSQGSKSIGEMIDALVLIYEALKPEEMHGRVEYL